MVLDATKTVDPTATVEDSPKEFDAAWEKAEVEQSGNLPREDTPKDDVDELLNILDKDDKSKSPEKETDKASKTDDKSSETGDPLSASQRRALKESGLNDDQVKELLESKRDTVLALAEQLDKNRREATARFAQLGQQNRPVKDNSPPVTDVKPLSDKDSPVEFDEAGLAKALGNEEAAAAIGKVISAPIKEIQALIPQLKSVIESVNGSQVAALDRVANSFFDVEKDVYGSGTQLTDEQVQNRTNVLEFANDIVTGAQANGKTITIDDALSRAHDHVASGFSEQRIVNDLISSLTARSDSRSIVPSRTVGRKLTEAALTLQEKEAELDAKLAGARRSA